MTTRSSARCITSSWARRRRRIRSRAVRRAALSALLALALAVPARAEEWFDAYERGLEALKQKKADRAIEMLERAARLRPDPGTNVITYGTNRLERYHPYLRLAEAYLLAGQPARAQDALKRSETRGREPAAERHGSGHHAATRGPQRHPRPAHRSAGSDGAARRSAARDHSAQDGAGRGGLHRDVA